MSNKNFQDVIILICDSHLFLSIFRYQTNLSKDILDTIMSIQPKDSGGGGGETRESVVYKLATDMLSKLPADYLPHEVHPNYKKKLDMLMIQDDFILNCV